MAGNVEAPVVIGGFAKTGLDAYVGRLVRAGYSVAIVTQNEHKESHLIPTTHGRFRGHSESILERGTRIADRSNPGY